MIKRLKAVRARFLRDDGTYHEDLDMFVRFDLIDGAINEILRLQSQVNDLDCNLHSCAGHGDWQPPYPEAEAE